MYMNLMTILFQMTESISIETIFKWYGLICMFSLPVSLATMIFIYRKQPDRLKSINERIDRLLDGENAKPENKAEENDKVPVKEEKPKLTIEEKNYREGIPNMILQVGDKYQCYLSDINRQNLGTDFTWSTDNPFIGNIHRMKGTYEAKKVGKGFIECGGGEHPMRIYYVDIRPNMSDWFAAKAMKDLLTTNNTANIKVRELSRQIILADEKRGILSYRCSEGTITYEADQSKKVRRFVYRLNATERIIEIIKNGIEEYMDPLKTKEEDTKYWIHRSGYTDDFRDSIDYIAFMKKASSGDIYFGCGESWRAGANEYEIKDNTDMLIRSFANIIDSKDIPIPAGKALKMENPEENEGNKKGSKSRRKKDSKKELEEKKVTEITVNQQHQTQEKTLANENTSNAVQEQDFYDDEPNYEDTIIDTGDDPYNNIDSMEE